MKKVNWLIEKNIFDCDEEFLEELKRQGYSWKETNYLRFHSTDANEYFSEDECVLFRGTLNLGRNILRTSWIPGAYMDEKNLRCTTYYTYFGQYLLNNKYFILSLGELIRRREEILEYLGSDGDLFVRPDSNMKSFRAGVFNLNVLNTMQSLGSELKRDETTLILVSGKRAIAKEWRFFVYKNQIITGSLYLVGEERIDETIQGGYLESYLSNVLKAVNWYPESLYTVDICESEGELHVLELGSFSCSGEYGCDLSLIIEAGAKAALEDYEAANDGEGWG
ncbi:ATP-grasp domain-containing protein [Dendronalium sp. ChiSLP03b]|uniref:ATP-grasp domain-containing protein n=1 Tax=Dendronalium sp. ChiSLP03b TaxID=3075381 RepID=UPI002AD38C5F|nr:ATP-grasp domain-containing protein [Dendronalium sp. ChiSLP03b]MDZ8207705.1 ATP-grasp domain-containing protein [Dendronalium sp. ChiSLP03b]